MKREQESAIGRKTRALDRVIHTAAEMIMTMPLNEIKISQIAIRAHCSTATIYEVYQNKYNLFDDVIARLLLLYPAPEPALDAQDAAMSLLVYMDARVRFFCNPVTRRLVQALRERGGRVSAIARQLMLNRIRFNQIADIARAAIDQGFLRPTDPEAIAYIIFGMAAYEPLLSADMFGMEAPIRVKDVLHKSLSPLVTEAGAQTLAAFCRGLPEDPPSGVQSLPLAETDIDQAPPANYAAMVRQMLVSLGVNSPSLTDDDASDGAVKA